MLKWIDLYLEQEQQDAAKCCEQYYTELSKAIELDFQKDHQRIEEDEEAIIMLLTLGYLGMPGSCSDHTYLTWADIPTMNDTA